MELNSVAKQEIENLVSQTDMVYKEVKFNDLPADKKSYIVSQIFDNRTYSGLNDYYKEYQKACILYDFNHVRFSDLASCINTYKKDFEIAEQTGVKTFLNNPAAVFAEEFVKLVGKTPLKEIAEIGTVLNKAVLNVKNAGNGGGGSGSGSGSGGSGGSSVSGGGSGSSDKGSVSAVIIPEITSAAIGQEENTAGEKFVFSDVSESHWAKDYISELYKKKIISGKGNGTFEPDASIKREEFIKMLITAANIDSVHFVNVFSDVEEKSWYWEYVGIAAVHKIALGKEDGTFGIGEEISRQDACVFLYRAAMATKNSLISAATTSELSFEDAGDFSDYAKESVQKLFAAGVISGTGDNNFSPLRSITRAEVSKILYSVFVEVN